MTRPSWEDFATHDESAFPELWDGVIGAWAPCLGPTGSRLHDMSRRSNWGTLTNMDNATDWVVDGGQYALDFDGSNDHVLLTDTNLPALGVASVFSASVWFYLSTLPSGRRELMPTPAITAGQFGAQLEVDAGKLRIRADNAGPASYTFADTDDAPVGQWVHAAGTWNGVTKTATLYKNGKSVGTADYSGNIASNTTQNRWLWGALEYASVVYFYWPGLLAEATIYNRVLSANEIQQLYQLGRGGMYQRRRRRTIYLPQAGFKAAWARGTNVLLGFNQP